MYLFVPIRNLLCYYNRLGIEYCRGLKCNLHVKATVGMAGLQVDLSQCTQLQRGTQIRANSETELHVLLLTRVYRVQYNPLTAHPHSPNPKRLSGLGRHPLPSRPVFISTLSQGTCNGFCTPRLL